jgi:predicted short-subunit dehydrogenase-like oxidoreductase (DUF2520 family)
VKNIGIGIVGLGRVGLSMTLGIQEAGYTLTALLDRNQRKLDNTIAMLDPRKGKPGTEPDHLGSCGLIIIAVQDSEIASVAGMLSSGNRLNPGAVIVHTCGARSVDVLQSCQQKGAHIGVMHPIRSFPGSDIGHVSLNGCWFGVRGDQESVDVTTRLAADLNGRAIEIDESRYMSCHLSFVLSSSYIMALEMTALQLLIDSGIPRTEARDIVTSLTESARANMTVDTPEQVLSGPLIRNDTETIRAHLDVIGRQHEELMDVYKSIARLILWNMNTSGREAPRCSNEMKDLLGSG